MAEFAKILTRDGNQTISLPEAYRFEEGDRVVVTRNGKKVVLEPVRKGWSRRFLALAGSAPDFPVPEEPPEVEPGPEWD